MYYVYTSPHKDRCTRILVGVLTADLNSNTFISPTKSLSKHIVPISIHLYANTEVPSVVLHHALLCLQEQYRNANLCNNLPLSVLHVLSDCFCVKTPKNGNYPTASLIETKLSKGTEAQRVHLQLLREIAPSSRNRICSTLA